MKYKLIKYPWKINYFLHIFYSFTYNIYCNSLREVKGYHQYNDGGSLQVDDDGSDHHCDQGEDHHCDDVKGDGDRRDHDGGDDGSVVILPVRKGRATRNGICGGGVDVGCLGTIRAETGKTG